MNYHSDDLYKSAAIARKWLQTHCQKDGTTLDIEGRIYNPTVWEAALVKYEFIVDELKHLGLSECQVEHKGDI